MMAGEWLFGFSFLLLFADNFAANVELTSRASLKTPLARTVDAAGNFGSSFLHAVREVSFIRLFQSARS